jgi:predicted dehydrogenase
VDRVEEELHMGKPPIKLAMVGVGNWGHNLLRNFLSLPDARVCICCDADETVRNNIAEGHPSMPITADVSEALAHPEVEAVVIATSVVMHYAHAKEALLAGKHVYVEKPLTMTVAEAEELVRIAEERRLKLMVGHLLIYHPAVTYLKDLVGSGELGEIFYCYSQRVNLGKVRKDENALFSFAPHDISVLLYLLEEDPERVSAWAKAYLQPGVEDVVFLNLQFADGKMAQCHVSWLDPHKVRKLTIVGDRKMVVFDDMESDEKIKIFDKGVERPAFVDYGESLTVRFGDIYIPRIAMTEPLRLECQHFLDSIRQDTTPLTDGRDGLRVVRVLEAAQASYKLGGQPMDLLVERGRQR